MATIGADIDIDDRPVTVTVYHRLEPTTANVAEEIVEQLEDFAAAGIIDGYDRIAVPGRQRRRNPEQQVVDELSTCAKTLGVSLDPALRMTDRHNEFTRTEESVCVLPVVTIVVHDATDDSILALAPIRTGDSLVTVDDLLAALSARVE